MVQPLIQLQSPFPELVKKLLAMLNEKEQDIIKRRFAINKGQTKKQTLNSIGQSYKITRERVRQIEATALKKLVRIAVDPDVRQIHEAAQSILIENGRVMEEELLTSEIIRSMEKPEEVDGSALKLAIRICDQLEKQEKNQFFRAFWRTADLPALEVRGHLRDITKFLDKKGVLQSISDLEAGLPHIDVMTIQSCLYIDWNFHEKDDTWGLSSWRHVNPRSIKDRVLIAFKEVGKPMHFSEVVNYVLQNFQGKKIVTHQAIHNELIRHPEFVLVGRGVYALKEWGLPEGTVADLIRMVLKENGNEPMSRADIIQAVLKKRNIQFGTVSLNLQKYACFHRVGRAMYIYDKNLEVTPRRRGRKKGTVVKKKDA